MRFANACGIMDFSFAENKLCVDDPSCKHVSQNNCVIKSLIACQPNMHIVACQYEECGVQAEVNTR